MLDEILYRFPGKYSGCITIVDASEVVAVICGDALSWTRLCWAWGWQFDGDNNGFSFGDALCSAVVRNRALGCILCDFLCFGYPGRYLRPGNYVSTVHIIFEYKCFLTLRVAGAACRGRMFGKQ